VSLGLKYLKRATHETDALAKTKLYDASRSFFCRGVVLLEQVRPPDETRGLDRADWANLLDYANRSAVAVAEAASNDRDYRGAMKKVLPQERLQECARLH
jgi:hypothetical protein